MHPLADTGRVIAGRYRLEAPIGRGAMGVVWRARDQLLDRDVAVKEVQVAETLTAEERANAYQRTLREAKTAARLNHPGVVAVYDVVEDGGRPWLVMQLVDAQSLDQVLATSGPLSPRRAAEVGRQLLSALSVAHAAGVMHRDVKPSNVLLGRDDRAVLTDFGIATFQGDSRLTQTGMVMGSPGFTAPERIRGEDATPASDLWSLGATLFAAVEGHGPYERRGGAVTTMSAIINEDAPPAPAAGALGPLIAALLRRAPADRPDTSAATRMITDALRLLQAEQGPGPASYAPTALSALAAADPHGGGEPSPAGAAATTPQPVLGGAARYDQVAYEPPPPDFSSWYDPAPRSGQAPSAQPWAGAAYQADPAGTGSAPWSGSAGTSEVRPDYRSPAPRKRRTGLWLALVLLAVLGAGAGAATIVLLRHSTARTPLGQGSNPAVSSSGTLPPATLQIVDAVNTRPGALPSGWATVTHHATGTQTAGFTIAAPVNWTRSSTGNRTYLRDPSANAYILIDLTPHTFPNDMVREAEFIRNQSLAQNGFPSYTQLGLAAETIRGTPGAWWKFTWTDAGTSQEAIDLLFVLQTPAGPQSYALYMTAPAGMWSQMRPVFDEEAETFNPLT